MKGLYYIVAAVMAGVSAVFALLAELARVYSLDSGSLGWIAGTAFLTALAAQLGLSRYADRGYGLLLLRVGVLAAVVGLLWFAAAAELWQFIVARGLLGAALGMIVPAARRAIVLSADGDAGKRLGMFYAAYISGFVFGPPLAGLLTEAGDVRLPFLVLGVIVAVAALALRGLDVDAVVPGEEGAAVPSGGVLRRLLRSRKMIAALLIVISFRYSVGVFEPLWAVFLDDLGATTMLITISLTLFALPMLLVATWAGGLTDRYGARLVSVLAAAGCVPLMAAYGWIPVIPILLGLAIAQGVLEAVLNPGTQVAVAEAAPQRDTAAAQGLAEAAGSAAAAVGAFTAAPAFGLWGSGVAWTIAGVTMAALVLGSAVLDRPRARVTQQVAQRA